MRNINNPQLLNKILVKYFTDKDRLNANSQFFNKTRTYIDPATPWFCKYAV